jgi:hypothetical protein
VLGLEEAYLLAFLYSYILYVTLGLLSLVRRDTQGRYSGMANHISVRPHIIATRIIATTTMAAMHGFCGPYILIIQQ